MRISDWSSDVCSSDLKPNIQEAENRVMAQILLAEDDASMREFLAKALRNAGHHVVAVGDGLDAMESLDGFRADLLLADVVMPGLDGIELARRAAKLDRTSTRLNSSH